MRRISALTLVALTCFAWAARSQAQPQTNSRIITFSVPGAGTGSGQGTTPFCNNSADAITGYYVDASGVLHGFLREPPRH